MHDYLDTLDHRLFDLAGNSLDADESTATAPLDLELTDLGMELIEFAGSTHGA